MRKFATALSIVLCFAGAQVVLADQHKTAGAPPKGEISKAVEAQATVTAIDLKTRMVTLKGPEGKEATLHVDKAMLIGTLNCCRIELADNALEARA